MSAAEQLDLLRPPAAPSRPATGSAYRAEAGTPPVHKSAGGAQTPTPIRTDREDAITWLKELVFPELIARALARVDLAEAPGVTADDVVQLCKGKPQAALLGAQQRAFSWVGPWLTQLSRAGSLAEFRLSGQPVRRRSTRPHSHGNLQIVYLHPTDHRAAQGAA